MGFQVNPCFFTFSHETSLFFYDSAGILDCKRFVAIPVKG